MIGLSSLARLVGLSGVKEITCYLMIKLKPFQAPPRMILSTVQETINARNSLLLILLSLLIRTYTGQWLLGFIANMGYCNVLATES